MKNLTRKLFLSICTLAICAVTLVSTTFAWYTTNTETKATGLVGATASTGDASIFISLDGSVWASSVVIPTTAKDLKPVMLDTDGSLISNTADDAITKNTHYIEFDLWFMTLKSEKDIQIGISGLSVYNTGNKLPELDNLLNGNKNLTDATAGISLSQAKYSINVVDALAMTINSPTTTAALDGKTAYALNAYKDTNKDKLLSSTYATNAHLYYNNVMGEDETLDDKYTAENYGTYKLKDLLAVLPGTGESVKVTFRVYLNGADLQCFDACKGQSFQIDFAFQVIGEQNPVSSN